MRNRTSNNTRKVYYPPKYYRGLSAKKMTEVIRNEKDFEEK
jgi:hypothetical protein